MPTFAIRCGRFYDGTSAAPRSNVTLVVADGRVQEIAERVERETERTIEAACVTPGLINSHVHLEADAGPSLMEMYLLVPPIPRTLRVVANARKTVEAGITTVRDLGAKEDNAIELAEAIARGDHPGPRIVAAGRPICMTGGHGYFAGREADGPWDVRRAVREQRRAGAHCIKLIATGGVLTKGAVPGVSQLTEEEMRAAVTEAHAHGMRVAAHAIGTEGIKNAARAGVDSIEHGYLLDDEALELLRERGTRLVPTLSAVSRIYENAQDGRQPEWSVRKATEIYERMADGIGGARRAGVTIAGGSDAGTPYNRHEDYAYELELMTTMLGMTPQEALTAATSVAAELLDVDAGVLAPGRPADLLILDTDAGSDVRALRSPRMVFKAGSVAAER